MQTTKYEIHRTSKFKREYKNVMKRGYDKQVFEEVVTTLAAGQPLDSKYCESQVMK